MVWVGAGVRCGVWAVQVVWLVQAPERGGTASSSVSPMVVFGGGVGRFFRPQPSTCS